MENIQKKAHIISSSSFVLMLLFCLLPFMSLRCSDTKIAEMSGVEMLTGSVSYKIAESIGKIGTAGGELLSGILGSKSKKSFSPEITQYLASQKVSIEEPPNVFMILVFLSAFAGIAVSIILKNYGKKYKISVAGLSAIIAVSLISMRFYINNKINSEVSKQMFGNEELKEIISSIGSMINISVNYEIGYWLCLLLSIALACFAIFIKKSDATELQQLKLPVLKINKGIVIGCSILALVAIAFFCFIPSSKTDIVPVKGANGEYQYIDISQNGKIVINPQFGEAHTFRDGLAMVKVSGGKWGYIDNKGKYIIAPTYDYAQDFSEGVAWVQLEDQPPMLIDKNGKTVLQIDSLIWAYPFSNGIAKISYYSEGIVSGNFINKKGEDAVTITGEGAFSTVINEGLYSFKSENSEKGGYKNKNGEIVIKEQFDYAYNFSEGVAVVKLGEKYGAIDKKGEWVINPQYDELVTCEDGLLRVKIGKKWGWINKKGEIVINPQFDDAYRFYGNKLAPVKIGHKWGYIDKEGQILINPQFEEALPFNGNYAMVINDGNKIGFIDQKGDFVVSPLYDKNENDTKEYLYAIQQKKKLMYYMPGINFGLYERLREKYIKYAKYAKASGKSFTDSRDVKKYKTVTIGLTQTWMAENLNFNAESSKCYNNDQANCNKYGRLYNWKTAKIACPEGWHLPSNAEWSALIASVGDEKTAGKYLKATSGWNQNGNGMDAIGFASLPGGYGSSDGNFFSVGSHGYWWSSSEDGSNSAYVRNKSMSDINEYVGYGNNDKSYLFSVRCVQD